MLTKPSCNQGHRTVVIHFILVKDRFVPGGDLVVGKGCDSCKKPLQLQVGPTSGQDEPISSSAITYVRGENLLAEVISFGSYYVWERSETGERERQLYRL